jgi:hypothetical protein
VVVTGAGLIKAYKPTQITTDLQETGIITHSVHPNPARDRLVITPDPADIGAPFALHDACGREVLRGRLWHAPSTSIDLSGIPSGAYFLRLGRHAERVIIE